MPPTLFHVGETVRKKALDLFNRSEETAQEDVNTIKEWMMTQPHLPEIMEDAKIRNFLLLNKHSIEETKQRIDMYYTIRSLVPDVFVESNPKSNNMRNLMDVTYCCVHPKLMDELYRVYFIKTKKPNVFAPREIGMQWCNISEIRLYEDCLVGEIIIFDMSDVTGQDLLRLTPSLLTKLVGVYENIFSLRVKAVYIINSPAFFVKVVPILKQILKPKIFSRIQTFNDSKILNDIFEKNELPKDYGGEGPSLEELNEMIKMKLTEYQSRFDRLDELRVNESLRPQKLNNDEILGFHGNFKKLSVD